MKKLSIRDQIVTAIFIQVIIYFLAYLGYYFLIINTDFYQNRTMLANLIVAIPLIVLFLIITTKVIERATKQIQDINRSLVEFYEADFETLIKESKNANLRKINENLLKLQERTKADILELQKKNDEITNLVQQQKDSYDERNKIIASLSHDLKTPLTVIQTTIYAIRDGIIDKSNIDEELNNLSEQINKTIDMLQKMLLVFKKGQEVYKSNVEEFNITPEIDNNIVALQKLIEKHEHILSINYFGNPIVRLDKGQFNQIINNLLVNAIVHSPNKNKISILLLDEEQNYKLDISNTGTEISKENLDKIFNPFYKIDESRNQNEPTGNGLGLYIVKELCKQNNIDISVTSANNKTTFTLLIKK